MGDARPDSAGLRGLIWIILLATGLRVAVWGLGHPLVAPDTASYRKLAVMIQTRSFVGFSGLRTPGYPLLFVVARQSDSAVWVLQLLMGVGTSALLYVIAYRSVRSAFWASLAAAAYAFGPHFLGYECYLLSETLATFLLVGGLALFVWIADNPGSLGALVCSLLGLLLGFGALTKPSQLFVAPVLGVAILMSGGVPLIRRLVRTGLVALPAAALVVGWCLFNKFTIGAFTMSTMTGAVLVNACGSFIGSAAPEYQDLVRILVPHREEVIREKGTSDFVWAAYGEMKQARGLSDVELGKVLAKMAFSAAVRNPLSWARAVAVGWSRFWLCPGGLLRELTGSKVIWIGTIWPYLGANLLYLSLCGGAVVSGRIRRALGNGSVCWVIIAIVAVASFAQAVLEGTTGTRYAIPYQPLFFVVIVTAASRLLPKDLPGRGVWRSSWSTYGSGATRSVAVSSVPGGGRER